MNNYMDLLFSLIKNDIKIKEEKVQNAITQLLSLSSFGFSCSQSLDSDEEFVLG